MTKTPTPETDKVVIEYLQKRCAQLRAFQRSRPDLPQDEFLRLSPRDQNEILEAKEIADAEARGGPELVKVIKRAHKTGYIKSGQIATPKKKK